MLITSKWLVEKDACAAQYQRFVDTFGESVEVTRAVLAKHGAAFDLTWLVCRLLTPEQRADYEAQVAPLWAAYKAQVDPLWVAYAAQVAPLRAAYNAQVAPPRAAYNAQVAIALADVLKL